MQNESAKTISNWLKLVKYRKGVDIMCARLTLAKSNKQIEKELQKAFMFDYHPANYPSYNIPPSSKLVTVINTLSGYRIGELEWGFKLQSGLIVNARSETAHEKKLFKEAINIRRCLVPADGYYEWDKEKTPYYFHEEENRIVYFAGIYLREQDGHKVVLLTKAASKELSPVHDRMPVVFDLKEAKRYLDKSLSQSEVNHLFENSLNFSFHEVSPIVNSPKNNTEGCIKPFKKNTLF